MNSWCGIGRLVREPEVRFTQSNKQVVSFTIAVNKKFKNDEADFIPVVAWEKTAEFIAKYFRKGQQIAIEGRLQTRSYEDNEGKKRFVMEVLAEQVHFAGEKKEGQQEEFRPEEYTIENDDELPF